VYDTSAAAKKIYGQANDVLGYDLAKICFEGPEEDLTKTQYSQLAIFTTSIAVLEALREKVADIKPQACLGLSLGEYSALVAAGALSFTDGLALVQVRANAMEKAAAQSKGTMASIIGLDVSACSDVCDGIDGVSIANLNSPEQIVISGTIEGVEAAMKALSDKGAKRVIPLKVSGAFHSALMSPAQDELAAMLNDTTLTTPSTLFIPNVTAAPEDNTETIKHNLLKQLTGTVRWSESFQHVVQAGITSFLEVGPGNVLKGLARRIDRAADVVSIETSAHITSVIDNG